MGTFCRHCKRRLRQRPGGLCTLCYGDLDVRRRYVVSVGAGCGWQNIDRPLPARPTQTLPGSIDKVAVLAARAALEQQLWHPGDLTLAQLAAGRFLHLLGA